MQAWGRLLISILPVLWFLCKAVPGSHMTSFLPLRKPHLYAFSISNMSFLLKYHPSPVEATSSNHVPRPRVLPRTGCPVAEDGTCCLNFSSTSPVLSFQEAYLSLTRTVYLGLQIDRHPLLQVCSQSSASIHFFCSSLRISVLC